MNAHAKFAPSDSERWSTCTGAVALERHLFGGRRRESSSFADEGTDAHTLAAMCLAAGGARPSDFIGKIMPKGNVVSLEMAQAIDCYVEAVHAAKLSPGYLWSAHEVGVSVKAGKEPRTAITRGTADFILLTDHGAELQVHDLKYGIGVPVSPVRNRQAMLYAIGALCAVPNPDKIQTVRIVIHQPRIDTVAREWECSAEYLRAFADTMHTAIAQNMKVIAESEGWTSSLDADPHLVPSDKACRWCAAKPFCPAIIDDVERFIAGAASKADIAPLFDSIERVKGWIKAVGDAALEAARADAMPGYKIVEGRAGNRTWTNEAAVKRLLCDEFHISPTSVTVELLLSPAQMDRAVKLDAVKRKELDKMISRAPGRETVVKCNDKRPALSADDMFD